MEDGCEEAPVCIILMDCNMPEMDGFKTTLQITEKCHKSKVKMPHMIALTATVDDEDVRVRCEQHGLQQFF